MPFAAGLSVQRQLCDPLDELVQRVVDVEHIGFALQFIDRGVAENSVGETAGVGHQLPHRHRMLLILQSHVPFLVQGEYLQVRELGNVLGDRIVELPFSLLEQHHHGHPRDGLAHGIDAKDAVLLHGRVGRDVALTHGFELHHLAVARDQGDDAGEAALIHEALHALGEPSQPFAGHGDAFRLGLRQFRWSGGERRDAAPRPPPEPGIAQLHAFRNPLSRKVAPTHRSRQCMPGPAVHEEHYAIRLAAPAGCRASSQIPARTSRVPAATHGVNGSPSSTTANSIVERGPMVPV